MAKPKKKSNAKSKPTHSKKTASKSGPSAAALLVGRDDELRKILGCIGARRSVLLEGPVGVGKTHLAIAATTKLGRPVFRIDGDSRYTEQKLTGWFDPPTVMKRGFVKEAFTDGPLVEAMRSGGILFINELNRLPEGVQNVLLPALDEKKIALPRLGEVRAKPEFMVIATQNPKEFVATSHLSEAILDRFELITIGYQSESEEFAIVHARVLEGFDLESGADLIARAAVRLARATRGHPRIRRGASIRAALAVAELTAVFLREGAEFRQAFHDAARMALPTRIELEREGAGDRSLAEDMESLLDELADDTLGNLDRPESEKKKD
ncbi:MAG: MoxR family ATPase [Bdellovibrionales bacterium]|nr:MoxR family ATPase [Bdellovibrionales bacterium]